jgi:hypothetical protein
MPVELSGGFDALDADESLAIGAVWRVVAVGLVGRLVRAVSRIGERAGSLDAMPGSVAGRVVAGGTDVFERRRNMAQAGPLIVWTRRSITCSTETPSASAR